jgi:hypothetical protein
MVWDLFQYLISGFDALFMLFELVLLLQSSIRDIQHANHPGSGADTS